MKFGYIHHGPIVKTLLWIADGPHFRWLDKLLTILWKEKLASMKLDGELNPLTDYTYNPSVDECNLWSHWHSITSYREYSCGDGIGGGHPYRFAGDSVLTTGEETGK